MIFAELGGELSRVWGSDKFLLFPILELAQIFNLKNLLVSEYIKNIKNKLLITSRELT